MIWVLVSLQFGCLLELRRLDLDALSQLRGRLWIRWARVVRWRR